MLNLTSDTGLAYRNYGGPWMPALPVQNTAVAFAVNGTPVASSVPEPAVLVLLASALGASWTRRQRATAARARRPQSSAQKNKP